MGVDLNMKIILESVEDLKELITYFNNGYDIKEDEIETFNVDAEIPKINNKIKNLIEQVSILWDKVDNRPVETKKQHENKNIRGIKEPYAMNMDKIVELTPEGKFKREGSGVQYFKWTIEDVLRIRNAIHDFDKYPSIKSIVEMAGFSDPTVRDLIYYIENGDFDKYFNEWEQIQANDFFKKNLNVNNRVINDPQKRRENGLI